METPTKKSMLVLKIIAVENYDFKNKKENQFLFDIHKFFELYFLSLFLFQPKFII